MKEYEYFNDPSATYKNQCIYYANLAHNIYFEGKIGNREKLKENKCEFIKNCDLFLKAIRNYLYNKFNTENLELAANNIFLNKNPMKARFFLTEFKGVEKRIRMLTKNPNLINDKNIFILEHTARFIEVLLPNTFACENQVEKNNKFDYELKQIAKRKFDFFEFGKIISDDYLHSFYECAYISQKSINSCLFIKEYLKNNYNIDSNDDPVIKNFFKCYLPFDYKSNLIFSRLSLEHFLKYLNLKIPGMWDELANLGTKKLSDSQKKDFIKAKNINDRNINTPARISALIKLGKLDRLMANELLLVNSRGNNIAHSGIPGLFSTAYHNLEVLNCLYKYYK